MRHETKNQTLLLTTVIRSLLATEKFETLADLTAALKGECARLRLLVTNDAIGDALRLVGSNTRLLR